MTEFENSKEWKVFLIRRELAHLFGFFKLQDMIITTEVENLVSRLQEKEYSEKSSYISLLPFSKLM